VFEDKPTARKVPEAFEKLIIDYTIMAFNDDQPPITEPRVVADFQDRLQKLFL
jgi:hypothetical protein